MYDIQKVKHSYIYAQIVLNGGDPTIDTGVRYANEFDAFVAYLRKQGSEDEVDDSPTP